jgi:hypothetical protein
LFTVEARKRLPYPDSASAALRIGNMRRGAFADYANSVKQTPNRGC